MMTDFHIFYVLLAVHFDIIVQKKKQLDA